MSQSSVRRPQRKPINEPLIHTQRGFVLFKLLFILALIAGCLWLFGKMKKTPFKMPGGFLSVPQHQSVSGKGVEFSEKPVADIGTRYYPEYRGGR